MFVPNGVMSENTKRFNLRRQYIFLFVTTLSTNNEFIPKSQQMFYVYYLTH